jgi:predicted acetyltransferase
MSDEKHPRRTDWDLRVPTSEQLHDFMQPVSLAFAEEGSGPETDDWIELLEPERWLGAFESPDSQLVTGGGAALSVRLTVPGGEVAAAAVTAVAVRPDHRRRGILRAIMRRQLDDIRAAGEPLAVLWASEGAIYQRFGYGFAAAEGSFRIARDRTVFARGLVPEGRVRIVDEQEAVELIPPVYEAMRTETPAAISRSQRWWQQVLADPEYSRRGESPKYRVVYEADGRAEGYAIYRIKNDWDHLGPQSVLQVKEAVTNSPRALRELWRFLFDVDLVRSIKAARVPLPTPLQHLLAEPRALGLVATDGLWARLVDLPAALEARRYATADELVLDVADDFCAWNAGRWQVRTSGEPGNAAAEIERTEAMPDVVLDTADLAAVYFGGVHPRLLADAGRIEERTDGAVRRLGAMFASERDPWCVSMF